MFDFSIFPTLTTERLLLRGVVPADAPDVFATTKCRSTYSIYPAVTLKTGLCEDTYSFA